MPKSNILYLLLKNIKMTFKNEKNFYSLFYLFALNNS